MNHGCAKFNSPDLGPSLFPCSAATIMPAKHWMNFYFWFLIWIIQVVPSELVSNCSFAEQLLPFCLHHLQLLRLVVPINRKIICLMLLISMNFKNEKKRWNIVEWNQKVPPPPSPSRHRCTKTVPQFKLKLLPHYPNSFKLHSPLVRQSLSYVHFFCFQKNPNDTDLQLVNWFLAKSEANTEKISAI